MSPPSGELLTRWEQGDQYAAEELFHRYTSRLVALARSRLSMCLTRYLDAEDVVQSAYRSFFADARRGRYSLSRNGDMWRLLVAITLHKLRKRVAKYSTQKRSLKREIHNGEPASYQGVDRDPTPAEAAALADTFAQVLNGMDPLERRIIEARLQGYRVEEIAADVQRSERTVRRLLERAKERMKRYYPERSHRRSSATGVFNEF